MTDVSQILAAMLVLAGAFFCFVASVGILRLEDLFMRMHVNRGCVRNLGHALRSVDGRLSTRPPPGRPRKGRRG